MKLSFHLTLLVGVIICLLIQFPEPAICVRQYTKERLLELREQVRGMFQYAYEGYLQHAADYDELRPLTCDGVDTWGSYSLTLIDALDTLAVMGNYSEFRRVASILESKMNFDKDINVSVFETNIRIVGGLLSAHLFSKKAGVKLEEGWPCQGPLLRLAEDVAKRLLPAFDTATGMPYGTVNLRHGVPKGETTVTCTAGVGTFLVEFGTLSRLTGNSLYEEVALNAAYAIWEQRSQIGLLGNHIDVKTARWTALDSGIGAGVDSFFEYLVKGSMLLNRPNLLQMFHEARASIDKYLKRDDWYIWAHMNKGQGTLPVFQSLEAFWPGILSIIGDVGPALRTISKYTSVWQKYGFLPEFYNILMDDTQVNRETYPLRPELIESAMYLYRATQNENLLEFGEQVLESIEFSAKTKCGYATIRNVLTHEKENRMESFFLAETTKYLYLLFDVDNLMHRNGGTGEIIKTPLGQCVIHSGPFIFNTEAHPIDMSALHCCHDLKENIFDFLKENPFTPEKLRQAEKEFNLKKENEKPSYECPKTTIASEEKIRGPAIVAKDKKDVYDTATVSVDIEVFDNENRPASEILIETFEKIKKERDPNYQSLMKSSKRNQLTIVDLEGFFEKKRKHFKSPADVLIYVRGFMSNFTLDAAFIKGLHVFDKSLVRTFGNEIQKIYDSELRSLWELYDLEKQFFVNAALIEKFKLLSYNDLGSRDTLQDFLQAFNLSDTFDTENSQDFYLSIIEMGKVYEKSMTNTTQMQEFLLKILKNGSNVVLKNFTSFLNDSEIQSLPKLTLDLEETFEVFAPTKRLIEIKKRTMETFEKLQSLMKEDQKKLNLQEKATKDSSNPVSYYMPPLQEKAVSRQAFEKEKENEKDLDFKESSSQSSLMQQKLSRNPSSKMEGNGNASDSVWSQLVQAILRTASSQVIEFDEDSLLEKTRASLEKYKDNEMNYELFTCSRQSSLDSFAHRVFYPGNGI